MTFRIYSLIAAASMMLLGCTTTDPTRLALSSTSEKAIILMKVGQSQTEYDLSIVRFDPVEQKTKANSFGGWASLKVKPDQSNGFVARSVDPGDYVIQDFAQQTYWAVCFHEDTLSFNARAGQIVYLGAFDPRPHFAQLGQNAIGAGRLWSQSGDRIHFFDNIRPPSISDPNLNRQLLAEAKKYVETEMLNADAPVVAANYKKTNFGTGRSLFGEKLCGGYFNKPGQKVDEADSNP